MVLEREIFQLETVSLTINVEGDKLFGDNIL